MPSSKKLAKKQMKVMAKLAKDLKGRKLQRFLTFFNLASAEKQAIARQRIAQQKIATKAKQNALFLSLANVQGLVYDNNPAANTLNAGGWHFQ